MLSNPTRTANIKRDFAFNREITMQLNQSQEPKNDSNMNPLELLAEALILGGLFLLLFLGLILVSIS